MTTPSKFLKKKCDKLDYDDLEKEIEFDSDSIIAEELDNKFIDKEDIIKLIDNENFKERLTSKESLVIEVFRNRLKQKLKCEK